MDPLTPIKEVKEPKRVVGFGLSKEVIKLKKQKRILISQIDKLTESVSSMQKVRKDMILAYKAFGEERFQVLEALSRVLKRDIGSREKKATDMSERISEQMSLIISFAKYYTQLSVDVQSREASVESEGLLLRKEATRVAKASQDAILHETRSKKKIALANSIKSEAEAYKNKSKETLALLSVLLKEEVSEKDKNEKKIKRLLKTIIARKRSLNEREEKLNEKERLLNDRERHIRRVAREIKSWK